MDQPSKGVFQGLKQHENLSADTPEIQLCSKAVPPSRVHQFLHTASQNTDWNIPAKDCPLHCFSDGHLTNSTSAQAAPARPPSLHSGISQPEVSLLIHPVIQYQKVLLL